MVPYYTIVAFFYEFSIELEPHSAEKNVKIQTITYLGTMGTRQHCSETNVLRAATSSKVFGANLLTSQSIAINRWNTWETILLLFAVRVADAAATLRCDYMAMAMRSITDLSMTLISVFVAAIYSRNKINSFPIHGDMLKWLTVVRPDHTLV